MKLKIVFHQNAIDDLEDIWLYTLKQWSAMQADRYYNLILDEVEFLAKKPDSGKDMNYLREGYKSSKVKSHIIFYKHSKIEIEIIRILHVNMDIPNRLSE